MQIQNEIGVPAVVRRRIRGDLGPNNYPSVLFATEHRLWFAGLLAGLAYGWLYKRSGNLWVPIVAHALTNALLAAYVLATGSWSFW